MDGKAFSKILTFPLSWRVFVLSRGTDLIFVVHCPCDKHISFNF